MNKTKVVIIDTEEEISNYKNNLTDKSEIEIVGSFAGGENVIQNTLALNPDVVVMELILPSVDGFEVISKLKSVNKKVKIVVVSNLNTSAVVSKVIELGVDYFMMKPINYNLLARRVVEICASEFGAPVEDSKKLEEKITNIFLTVGIPAHIKGYQFLREAIKMAVGDPHIINSITKRLYPNIAEMFDTTASKVERAIRHAIEVAWNKGKIENINDVFGLHVYDTHEKPTNGEFIALVADKMLLEK